MIRIIRDVYAGMGYTMGITITITDKIVLGMVGVDIGCGMEIVKLPVKELDLQHLYRIIWKTFPTDGI